MSGGASEPDMIYIYYIQTLCNKANSLASRIPLECWNFNGIFNYHIYTRLLKLMEKWGKKEYKVCTHLCTLIRK